MINASPINALAERGIDPETISRYRISPTVYSGRPAISYPTVSGTALSTRIKFMDGEKPKYIWDGHDDSCIYYSAGGLIDAIKANDGVVYLVNGEAATWAFHSYHLGLSKAAKIAAPCVSWFGENSVPATLADDLKSWGVTRSYLIVDCDEAGYKAALKIMRLFGETGFPCLALKLPFEYGSGADFNDLWIKCEFDANKTAAALLETDVLTLPLLEGMVGKPTPDTTTEMFRPSATVGNHSGDVDFKALQQQWVAEIIASLGAPAKREGKIDRWNCPVHDDADPSFRIEYKAGELPRPRCSCDIHSHKDAWGEIARAKGQPTWEEFYKERLPKPTPKASQPNPAPTTKRQFRKGSDVLNSLDSIVAGNTAAIGNPVMFPFKSMHFLGGLCRYIPAGMLVGIVGGSGEGKTSLVETFVDFWNKGGIDVVFYSPEWTSELIMQRRIQRYSGFSGNPHVTVDDFTALTLYYKERDLDIPENQRDGSLFSEGQKQAYDSTKKQLLTWKGETLIACDDDPTQPLFLETFLEMTADTLADVRRQKRRADVVAVDYLQLAEVLEDKKNEVMVNQVIRKIKQHATVHKYVGFDASQITKASSKSQKNGGGMVTGDDAMAVRSDKFNLMLTINRVFKEVDGEKEPTDLAHLFVDKNSLGRAKQKLLYRTDYAHLRWLDERIDEKLP